MSCKSSLDNADVKQQKPDLLSMVQVMIPLLSLIKRKEG
jgi:hypothetical protein